MGAQSGGSFLSRQKTGNIHRVGDKKGKLLYTASWRMKVNAVRPH